MRKLRDFYVDGTVSIHYVESLESSTHTKCGRLEVGPVDFRFRRFGRYSTLLEEEREFIYEQLNPVLETLVGLQITPNLQDWILSAIRSVLFEGQNRFNFQFIEEAAYVEDHK